MPEEYPLSSEALKLASKWFTACQKTHLKCVKARTRVGKLPKRVLDVNCGTETMFLHETDGDKTGDNATLSYCWGKKRVFNFSSKQK